VSLERFGASAADAEALDSLKRSRERIVAIPA
jgi:hypothetical protein